MDSEKLNAFEFVEWCVYGDVAQSDIWLDSDNTSKFSCFN